MLVRAQSGDSSAENELLSRYERMSRSVASKVAWVEADFDDARQEALIGGMRAIRQFKTPEDTAGFSSYMFLFMKGGALESARKSQTVVAVPKVEGWKPRDESLSHPITVGGPLKAAAFPDESPLPDALLAQQEIASEMKELVENTREMDAADRIIFQMRIIAEEPEPLKAVAVAAGLSVPSIYRRELRLMEEVLPRVFASLREAT